MGLLWDTGLGESQERAEPVEPEPSEALPAETLLPRGSTLFLWLAGFTVTMRLWLLATIMSVTWRRGEMSHLMDYMIQFHLISSSKQKAYLESGRGGSTSSRYKAQKVHIFLEIYNRYLN